MVNVIFLIVGLIIGYTLRMLFKETKNDYAGTINICVEEQSLYIKFESEKIFNEMCENSGNRYYTFKSRRIKAGEDDD